jgi:hypothetical protein
MAKAKETKNRESKPNYWDLQGNAFVNSFRTIAKKSFLKSALFDLLTILIIIILLNLSISLVNIISANALPNLANVIELKQGGDDQAFNEALAQYSPVLTKVLWISLIIFLVCFLLLIFFISWFYGKAWCYALQKKFSSLYLRKYFFINLTWAVAWLVIIFLTSIIFVSQAAAIILILEFLVFLYSDPVLRAVFDEHKNWKQNWLSFFKTAGKIHWFVLFIIIALIISTILLTIAGLLANITPVFAVVIIIIALFLLGWMRNYIIQLVSSMKN